MSFWEQFPYTNFHDLNLDWIMGRLGKLKSSIDEARTYAENAYTSVELSNNNAERAANSAELAANSAERSEQAYDNAVELYNNLASGRRYVLIGDSYGVNTTRDGLDITGWCSRVKQTMGFTDYVCTYYAQSGAGFVHGGADGNFSHCLDVAYGLVEDAESITDIVVLGGYNDHSESAAEISLAIDAFIAKAKQLFPSAVVHVGFIGRRSSSAEQSVWRNLFYVYNVYTNAPCGHINNIEYACRAKQYFVSDGVHPNNDGQKRIANALCAWIRGGYTAVDASNFVAGNITGNMSMNGPITRFSVPSITINGAQESTIDLGEITQGWILSFAGWSIIPIMGTVKDSNGVWRNCTFYMSITNDCHLVLTPRCVTDSGWVDTADYATISILVQTVNLPTMLC